jgi:hypothetical protein
MKSKENYIYYNVMEEDGYKNFYTRMNNAFFNAMIHTDHQNAAAFYTIKKYKNNQDLIIKFENLKQGRNTGKSLDQDFYITLKNIVDKIYLVNQSVLQHDKHFLFMKHVINAKSEYINKKRFTEYDPMSYKKIILEVQIDAYSSCQIQNDKNIDEFFDPILEELKYFGEYHNIEEIAIFYPVQYQYNIFSDQHYLFEINPYKFQIKTPLNKKMEYYLDSYFKTDYQSNKRVLSESYENKINKHHGKVFNKNIAYFNPILFEDEYLDDLTELINWINENSKKIDSTAFYNSLFDKINIFTFHIVVAQFESLLNDKLMKKYESKFISRREFVEYLHQEHIDDVNEQYYYSLNNINEQKIVQIQLKSFILLLMIDFYKNNDIKKNQRITAEDLNLKGDAEKEIFESIQCDIDLFYQNKKSMNHLLESSMESIKLMLKEYKIPQNFHKTFRRMFLNIITFDISESNLKKPYNKFIENIHKNISKEQLRKKYDVHFRL